MSDFKVHILGCGSAKPNLYHHPSCTVLNIRESLYMIDCGEGAQLEMQRQRLKFNRLNHIFLTHLHGDHVFGLPGLLGSLSLMKRQGTVTVHTFREGIAILQKMMDFFNQEMSYNLVFHEIKPESAVIYEDKHIKVRTISLNHRVPCVGYVFEEQPRRRHLDRAAADFHGVPVAMYRRIIAGEDFVKADGTRVPNAALTRDPSPQASYAHIGDTAYVPAIAQEIGPVNVLYHESTYLKENIHDAAKRGHSTAAQAAMMARGCGAGQLLLGHYSSRYKDDSLFLKEAQEIFPDTIAGNEGLCISL